MYIFFIIIILDVIALYLISCRIDSEAHFTKMDEMLFDKPGRFLGNLILLMIYLPFTIIYNLKQLFRK